MVKTLWGYGRVWAPNQYWHGVEKRVKSSLVGAEVGGIWVTVQVKPYRHGRKFFSYFESNGNSTRQVYCKREEKEMEGDFLIKGELTDI